VPVLINEIVIGGFYVTSRREVRRVVDMRDGKVTYEGRSHTTEGDLWGPQLTVGAGKFAREAVRKLALPPQSRA
jgi:hypothetical protein